MPLRTGSWHVINAAIKAAFGYAILVSFLGHRLTFGSDNITDSGFQDYDNISSYCTDPGGILHGHRKPMSEGNLYFSNGTELEFVCQSDYLFILGDGVITCVSGRWVPPRKPLCIPYVIGDKRPYCIQPPYTPYSVLNSGMYKEYDIGSTLHFDCLQGYQVVGSSIITCGEDGEWYPSPKCRLVYLWLKDIESRSATPDRPSAKSEATSVMKIISYLAVPVLVGFVIAIMLNLKNHSCLNLNRHARASQDTAGRTRGNDDSPTGALNHNTTAGPGDIANLHLSFQHYWRPFRPPSYPYSLSQSVYTVSSQNPDTGLPSYEEAVKDSSPPSFDVACGLESAASPPDSINNSHAASSDSTCTNNSSVASPDSTCTNNSSAASPDSTCTNNSSAASPDSTNNSSPETSTTDTPVQTNQTSST